MSSISVVNVNTTPYAEFPGDDHPATSEVAWAGIGPSGQGRLFAGAFRCHEPATYEQVWEGAEAVYMLEGEMKIELDGAQPTTLRPGDLALVPAGSRGRVTFLTAVSDIFVGMGS